MTKAPPAGGRGRSLSLWVPPVTLVGMSTTAAPRTADELNERIRALVEAGPVDAARYRELVVAWAEAVRREQQVAA